jgi:hypothetical protein
MLATRLDVSVIDSVASAKKCGAVKRSLGPLFRNGEVKLMDFLVLKPLYNEKKKKKEEKLRLLKQN